MATANHDWSFVSTRRQDGFPYLLAICGRCGLVRSATIPGPNFERHIALAGPCPGAPQPQEDRPIRRGDVSGTE